MDNEEKLSNEEVAQVIMSEGLGDAIMYYMGPDRIEDPITSKLWSEARTALNRLEYHLEPWMEES